MAKDNKLTHHGKLRMKQRSGITSGTASKVADRALKHGIRAEDTKGELKVWCDSYYTGYNGQLRIYGKMAYIFKNNRLITTLYLPDEITLNLPNYIDDKAYQAYLDYKNQLKRAQHINEDNYNPLIGNGTYKTVINRYCKDSQIDLHVLEIIRQQNTLHIYYTSNEKDADNNSICEEIKKWIEQRYYLPSVFERVNTWEKLKEIDEYRKLTNYINYDILE